MSESAKVCQAAEHSAKPPDIAMTLSSATVNGWLNTATGWAIAILKLALVLMVGAVALSRGFGIDLPYVATLDPYGLALICGGFWLVTR